MNYFNFLSVISIFICLKNVSAIINGEIAEKSDFKYMVSLWYYYEFCCGGAILDEVHILTAAHCVYRHQNPYVYSVQLRVLNLIPGESTKLRVKTIHIHHDFNPSIGGPASRQCLQPQAKNDIAVLTLLDPISLNEHVQRVERPKRTDSLPFCSFCYFAGWGVISRSERSTSPALRYAKLAILEDRICKMRRVEPRDNEFCAIHALEQQATGQGDSGGPLVCNGIVFGVMQGSRCGTHFPMILSSVIKHLDFIEGAMNDGII